MNVEDINLIRRKRIERFDRSQTARVVRPRARLLFAKTKKEKRREYTERKRLETIREKRVKRFDRPQTTRVVRPRARLLFTKTKKEKRREYTERKRPESIREKRVKRFGPLEVKRRDVW